jgi:glycosyltransferase involved in cell wall biosynthesis
VPNEDRAKIKVAHVITRLDFGGAQLNTIYTARNLNKDQFDVFLVCGRGGFFDSDVTASPLVRTIYVDSLKRSISPIDDIRAVIELIKIFRAEKPDVVHTHSSKAGVLGRIAAWLAKVPVIIHTYHGFGFHERQPWYTLSFFKFIERRCAQITTRLIFVSQANINYAKGSALLRRHKPELLRSGIKLSDYPYRVDAEQLKMEAGIGKHKKLVISIGNLKPQKNADDFVEVAALVLKKFPDARFAFLGDGPQRDRLESKSIALGLHDRLFFLGWRRDASQWLAAADVFVLTSLWEGLPRALVEAMKSGLPCVCYETDGVTDILKNEKNGYLIQPGDTQNCADRIVELLTNEALYKEMKEAALNSIGPEFDIDRMVRKQENFYRDLYKAALKSRD